MQMAPREAHCALGSGVRRGDNLLFQAKAWARLARARHPGPYREASLLVKLPAGPRTLSLASEPFKLLGQQSRCWESHHFQVQVDPTLERPPQDTAAVGVLPEII